MTEQDVAKVEAAVEALPQGPYQECGHERGGCKCGFVYALDGETCLLSTNTSSPDEGYEVPDEVVIANAQNVAFILNALPDLIARLHEHEEQVEAAEGERDEKEIEYPERYCVYCNALLVPRIAVIVGQSAKVESLQHFRNRLFCNGWCARGMD